MKILGEDITFASLQSTIDEELDLNGNYNFRDNGLCVNKSEKVRDYFRGVPQPHIIQIQLKDNSKRMNIAAD